MPVLDPEDRQVRWEPVWIVDITSAALSVVPQATFDPLAFDGDAFDITGLETEVPLEKWRFATRDLELTPPAHKRILNEPSVIRSLIDAFWGVTESTDFTVELDNADGLLTPFFTYDPRGKPITLTRYDYFSDTTVESIHGTISEVSIGIGTITIKASTPDLTPFEQQIPSVVLDVDHFSKKAVDIGLPLAAVFGGGIIRRVPTVFARDAVNANRYDFICGHGDLEVVAVWRDPGDGTLSQVRAVEFEVSTTIFPGYTTIRFRVRPVNFNSSFYKFYADLRVTNGSRNFALFVREVLSNTTWGLGRTVNEASFTAAAAALDAVGGLYCDVALTEQRPAQDYLRLAMMVRGMNLSQDSTGAWQLDVDTEATTAVMHVADGRGDGPKTLVSADDRIRTPLDQAVKLYKLRYGKDYHTGELRFTQQRTIHADFGQDREEENELITDHTTADKVCDYLGKKIRFAEDKVRLTLPQEARKLVIGDLILMTYEPLDIVGEYRQIESYEKAIDTVVVQAIGWDPSIYVYEPGTLPTEPSDEPVVGRIPRPGGFELVGAPRFQPCVFNPARSRYIGLANTAVFSGRTVRIRWHALAQLPIRGLDEDNLNRGETLIRDYVITVRGFRSFLVDPESVEEEAP